MTALSVDARYRVCVALRSGGLGVSCVPRVGSGSRWQGGPPKGEKASVDRTVEEGVRDPECFVLLGRSNGMASHLSW